MRNVNLIKGKISWQFVAIVLFVVALGIRLAYLPQIEHNVDHAYYIGQALRTLEWGELPIVGQKTSLQFPNSAFLGYVYLPFVALARTPLAVYVWVITLNALAVWGVYRIGALLFSPPVGIVAMLLMAFNPWTIEYSRNTWSYAFMPFTLTAQAFLLWRVLLGKSPSPIRDTVLAGGMMTVTTLITLTGYFIVPTTLLTLMIAYRRLPLKGVLWAGVIFAVPTMIFMAGIIAQWQTTANQFGTFLSAGQGATVRIEPIHHALRFVTGADYALQRGQSAPLNDWELRHLLTQISVHLVGISVLFGALWMWFNRQTRPQARLLTVWFAMPIVLMSYNSALVHPFYLVVTLPAGYLLAGVGIVRLLHYAPPLLKGVLVVLLMGICGLMWVNSTRYYQETAHIPSAHGLHALSLEWGLPLGHAVKSSLPTGGNVFAEAIEGWILNSFAGAQFPVIDKVTLHERAIASSVGALYVTVNETITPLFQHERVWSAQLPDSGKLEVYRVSTAQWELPNLTRYPIQGEKWVSLIGYHQTTDANNQTTLETYWQIEQPDAPLLEYVFTPTAHLVSPAQSRVIDGKPIASYLWQYGDIHAYRLSLGELEPETKIAIGFYDGNQQTGITFILPSGDYVQLIPLPE